MKTIELNDQWLFTKYNDMLYSREEIKAADIISLPHCWNAEDGQGGKEEYYRGKCWYQKKIEISADALNKYVFLEIGAAGLVSQVYINGHLAGSCKCGFAMYRVAITPYLKEGENIIAIMVDNTQHEDVYPLMADFTFYGGLYRYVKLLVADALHFELMDNSRDGIFLTQKCIDENKFELNIRGGIVSELPGVVPGKVKLSLNDMEDNIVFNKTINIQVNGKQEINLTEIIDNAILWQGIENPYLYNFSAELLCEEKVCDIRNIEIGFRKVEITPDRGVFLNGRPIKLNGVCRHQDFAGVGNAVTREQMELDMSLIKEIGANTIRLAHYQHNDYFYSLCDRAGLLVWAEIPFISIPTTSDPENKNAKEQLERLIKQVYNHSCVYCWGVQNEITIAVENEMIYKMVKELVPMVRELDSSRITAQANVHTVSNMSPLNELTDIVGYNLYYGWYYGEFGGLGERLDEFHKERPEIPVLVTEYGVDTNPRFHSYNPVVRDYTEEYQLLFNYNALKTFNDRQFVLGGYHWNMFDFGSAMRNEGGDRGKNLKGLVTIDRKLKKDAFYLFKAAWSKEPFIYLAGRRFVNRHEIENDITVISNLEDIKLFVNQELIGEIRSHEPLKRFLSIKLAKGDNIVKAEGYDKCGKAFSDEIIVKYTEEADKSYILEKPAEQRNVENWFQKFDLTNVQEVALKDGYFSTFDSVKEIYANEEAKAVFKKFFGDMAEQPSRRLMMELMSIDSMSKIKQLNIPVELLAVINKELNVIPKK